MKIIECPRDAMQGWPVHIPTADKIAYLNLLLQVGFDTIDFGSFVSPKAIPQMADTGDVLAGLDLTNKRSKLLAIIANERGADAALAHEAIDALGFPFSISETFQQRNTNSSIAESFERVKSIQSKVLAHGRELVVYLSMGFGNPYGDPYNEEVLLHWAQEMASLGIRTISLADTVGLASPESIYRALNSLIPAYPGIEFGVHLHSTPDNRAEKLDTALDAGCTRFDGAALGIGGCPMAGNTLVGNMDTVWMLHHFASKNISIHINAEAWSKALQKADSIFH